MGWLVIIFVSALWLAFHGYPGLLLLALGVALVTSVGRRLIGGALGLLATPGRSFGDSLRTSHSHGGTLRRVTADHESGHAMVARAIGGGVTRIKIKGDGTGRTSWIAPDYLTPAEDIAVAIGGSLAEGCKMTDRQCRSDQAHVDHVLRRVGVGRKGSTMREARRIATRALRRHRSWGRRTANRLNRSGAVRFL